MREIRRYYGGEQLSATKLNDLVDALRCLCSEARKLQQVRFTYGAQPINPERRYWAGSTEVEEQGETELWDECVCVKGHCIGTCRAAFELVKWGATEYTYLTPGAIWNGIDLDQRSWSRLCNTDRPLYLKEGTYYTKVEGYEEYSARSGEIRLITNWGVRGGVLMMKNGEPTHRGGGAYTRAGYIGYGAVNMSNSRMVNIYNIPYHLMSGGVDSWVGGRMNNGVESSQEYNICNSIKIVGTVTAGVPSWASVCDKGEAFLTPGSVQDYPLLFVSGSSGGISGTVGWLMQNSSVSLISAIPCYLQSTVKFWFCMGVNSTYLKESGFAEVRWNGASGRCNNDAWRVAVPIAQAFRNIYSGYVECVRILEEELVIQPTVYVTAPGGCVDLSIAATSPMTTIAESDQAVDEGCYGGWTAVGCVKDALWVKLPKTLSRQRFFPWGNVCSGFYTWDGCEGQEPEPEED